VAYHRHSIGEGAVGGAVGGAVECRILGPVEVLVDGLPVKLNRRRERHLLALLLLHVGSAVSTQRLIDLLWPDGPPDATSGALHTVVSRLRSALAGVDGVAVVRSGDGYAAAVDPDAVDAHRFRRLVERAMRAGDAATRADLTRRALSLWRGEALAGLGSEATRHVACAGLNELRRTALDLRVGADLALGRHEELIAELTEIVAAEPLDERFVAHLVVALYRAGRRTEALTTCQRARARLADELGIDPGMRLQRLEVAVLRADPALDHEAVVPVPAQLPLAGPGFVGRVPELARLDSILDAAAERPTTVVVSAVSGMAGVGKTALAVHWAHRVADRFPDGQLYVNLRGFDPGDRIMDPSTAVRGFLDALGVPAEQIPTDPDAQAGLYRSRLAGKRVLILLDNARDAEHVRTLLPGTGTAMVIVTSRNQLTPLAVTEGARLLTLDVLSAEDARALLTDRLGLDRIATERDAVDALIAGCSGLPLALAIAAARAQQTGFPLATIARELADTSHRLDALNAGDPASQLRAVFSWSYAALTEPAARMFRLLGLHPSPDLSAAAAASLAGLPLAAARRLLTDLIQANLLTEQVPGRYTLHDLLRAYAAEQTHRHDPEATHRAALTRMVDHYLHTAHAADRLLYPLRDPISLPLASLAPGALPQRLVDTEEAAAWFTAERHTLVAALRLAAAAGFDGPAWQLAWALDTHLYRRGHWHDEIAAWRVGLSAAARMADHAAQAEAHQNLAHTFARLDRNVEAETHSRHALALYTEVDNRVGLADVHRSLGYFQERQGRFRPALEHARQALTLYEAAEHRQGQARARNAIGWYHALLGEFDAAVVHCEQALALLHRIGDLHGQAATWDSLGYAHHHLGDQARAAECYRQSLALWRQLGDRYNEADILGHLGEAYLAAGDPGAARAAWQQALDILTTLDHSDTAAVRAKLAGIDQGLAPATEVVPAR
jgi:DNA-binding SARP family transcriptional activator/Tfp pilus assembly protein PilF